MASRKITDLHPQLQIMALDFEAACKADSWLKRNGVEVIFTCTHRSNAEQTALYAIGRTVPGNPCACGGKKNPIGTCAKHPLGLRVTNAKAGESEHNFTISGRPASKAFDVGVLRYGKLIWDTSGDGIDENPNDDTTDNLEMWERIGEIAESVGLEWAGRWKNMKEFPHMQRADV